ncbi:hypothetical protein TCAL_09246 [Tigriopus californicus]|uniref:Semaphorin-2A n=1 Tax=Tigriopus californicus TaxID=6832 RepID=A0A553NRA0_TIGCA|nr:hypothetical protein TCAL_09246 [Tigriopus californicus]
MRSKVNNYYVGDERFHALQESKDTYLVQTFRSNSSHSNFFKILANDAHSILVGGQNHVFNLSASDLSENQAQRITWFPTDTDRELCLVKGKSENDCQNYIRVLEVLDNGAKLLVCGTNAFNPRCRNYRKRSPWSHDWIFSKEFSGKGFCPFDPRHNSTAIFAGGHLYSGTVADFSGTDALIIRERLRTEQYDTKHLNNPDFVGAIEDDSYVYFFFRELAVEHMNCGKAVYARVARVCKQDKGGPHTFQYKWTSFLKARLNCSVPGEFPFYFDHLQSVMQMGPFVFGIFTTSQNSIAGSAICQFSLASMERTFDNDLFKSQDSTNSNWLAVSESHVPDPRPGVCSNAPITERGLNFIKHNNLMNKAIDSEGRKPLFVQVDFRERLLSLDVKDYDHDKKLIVAGTTHGRILKLVSDGRGQSTILEAIHLHDKPIRQVKIAATQKILAVTDDELQIVSLHRCGSLLTCDECLAHAEDPFCKWNFSEQKCIRNYGIAYRADLFQNIAECPVAEVAKEETTTEMAPPETSPPPEDYEAEFGINETIICPMCSCDCPLSSSTSAPIVPTETAQISTSGDLIGARDRESSSKAPLSENHFDDPSKNEIQLNRNRKELDIFFDFINGESNKLSDIQGLEEKYLPKRESPLSQNFEHRVTETTLAWVSLASALLSLVIGFVLGLLVARFCQHKSQVKVKGNPPPSVATVSDQLDPSMMQKPMSYVDDPDGDDHGFKSLPIHHSTQNGAAIMFPSHLNYVKAPGSLQGSFPDINQNSLVVLQNNNIAANRHSVSCGQSLRGSSCSREATSASYTTSTSASPSTSNVSRGTNESIGEVPPPVTTGMMKFVPENVKRIYL